jgi:hypothetical protein
LTDSDLCFLWAVWAGPEYEWKGPFPDDRECFLPRALGLPVEFNGRALNSDLKGSVVVYNVHCPWNENTLSFWRR